MDAGRTGRALSAERSHVEIDRIQRIRQRRQRLPREVGGLAYGRLGDAPSRCFLGLALVAAVHPLSLVRAVFDLLQRPRPYAFHRDETSVNLVEAKPIERGPIDQFIFYYFSHHAGELRLRGGGRATLQPHKELFEFSTDDFRGLLEIVEPFLLS